MTQTITPKDAAKLLANGEAVLIDVREPDEFKKEHIAYANSLPLNKLETLFKQMNIPENRKLIFQCLKGGRGQKACETINSCGTCTNEIYNMSGGITAWKDVGLPTASGAKGPSIFRQVQIIVGGLIALFVLAGYSGITPAFALAGILGAVLCFAGITGWCGLAIILKKMPWNR